MEILEERLAPATFAWTGQGRDGLFSNPNNWSNTAGNPVTGTPGMPSNGDSLVFPRGGISIPGTVTDDLAGTTNFASITFYANGWNVAAAPGSIIGITNGINHSTDTAGTNTITAPLSFAAAAGSVSVQVVNPANQVPSVLLLKGSVNLGAAGFTFSGFGELSVNATISGSGGIVADSSGTLTLDGANTYSGGTIVNKGVVDAFNFSTTLGSGAVTVNDGGTLQVDANGITNALTLNGYGYGGDGALRFGQNSLIYQGAVALQSNSSIHIAQISTLRGPGSTTGSIHGAAGLTIVGGRGSIFYDQCIGTYTGVTNVLGASLYFNSPAIGEVGGKNTGTSGYVISQDGALAVDDTVQLTPNRIGTTAFVELDGSSLYFFAASENFAALNLGNASPGFTGSETIVGSNKVDLETSGNCSITVGTLSRNPGSTVTFFGSNLGTTSTLTFGAFGAGSGLVNGILPYATVGPYGAATDFATHNLNGNTGIGVAARLSTPTANGGVGDGTENIKLTGPLTLTQDTFVNSLNFNGQSVTLGNFRLIVGSGGLLETTGTSASITGNGTVGSHLDFGTAPLLPGTLPFPADGSLMPVEGIITVADVGSLFLTTVPIAVGNNLTINAEPSMSYGAGGLTIDGAPGDSTYSGVTWVTSGTLTLSTSVAADIVPTPLVIGDNGNSNITDEVQITTDFQQIGTAAAPGNVIVNSTGELFLAGGIHQSIGSLTMRSGIQILGVNSSIGQAVVYDGGILTLTASVTSGSVVLSPTANLSGGIPVVSVFQSSSIGGYGTLILAPGGVASGTFTFNVNPTPGQTVVYPSGGGGDLILSVTIGGGSATLDKKGGGVLTIITLPQAAYIGTVQIDGGTFALAVYNFAQNILVNSGGTLGSFGNYSSVTSASIIVNGGSVNPGSPPSPLAPSNSQNGEYQSQSFNFSAGGILSIHIDGYAKSALDYDVLKAGTGGQITLGGTSILQLDLLGLAQWGVLYGKTVNGYGTAPLISANPLIGRFSNAPENGSMLPASDVLNNPSGFQAFVGYSSDGTFSLTLAHPSTVANSSYTSLQNTTLTVGTSATGILANVTNPDFNYFNSFVNSIAVETTVKNPGSFTGSAGGTLVVNADGTFAYTPAVGFIGTETFSLTATDGRGVQSAPFTVTFNVLLPPPPPPVTANRYLAVGVGAISSQVIVYDSPSGALVASFYAFTPSFAGGVRVALADFNGDGVPDIVAAAGPGGGPQVEVIDGTKLSSIQANGQIAPSALLASFFAFAPSFTGGVYIAAARSAAGQPELVVGAGAGGGPQVMVLDGTRLTQRASNGQIADTAILTTFFAYSPSFKGGVRVTLGDFNGDGVLDIVTGAGPGGGPQVEVIDGSKATQLASNGQISNYALLASFFAFAPSFTGGVYVSAGATAGPQVNLILGAGAGGGPQVEVVNGSQLNQLQSNGQVPASNLLASFFAFSPSFTGGVNVGFNGGYGYPATGVILTAPSAGGGPQVSVFDGGAFTNLSTFFALPQGFSGGLFLAG